MKRDVTGIIICFENVDICRLEPNMVDFIGIYGITENLQYHDKNKPLNSWKSCDDFVMKINEEGLKQVTETGKEVLLSAIEQCRNIVSIEFCYYNGKREEINVPWCDEDEYENKYQRTEKEKDGLIIRIKKDPVILVEEKEEKIEELKNKISELEGKIDKEENEGNWKPQNNEMYWFVNLDWTGIESTYWDNDRTDNIRYAYRVIFETKNEAEEYLEYLEEKQKHMDTFTEEEWRDYTIKKYSYFYNYYEETISWDVSDTYRENKPYFRTKEDVKDFMKNYKWQIKHELGVE